MAQRGDGERDDTGWADGPAQAAAGAAAEPAEPTAGEEAAGSGGEAEQYRVLLQRERADFINYRRRVEAERAAQVAAARAEALVPLLPILDDLERAASEAPAELREQPWVKGVLLIAGKLASAMQAAGLERIDAQGRPFDPRQHEAFLHQPHPTIPAGHVSSVMRPGYRLGDRVVRPAQVGVSQGAAEGEA